MRRPRRWIRGRTLWAGVLVLAVPEVASPHQAADQIHWTITGPASVTFNWRGTWDRIYYGRTARYDRMVRADAPTPYPFSSSGPFWEARITGLAPDTEYHYSIDGGPNHTFRTPPPRGSSDFAILVIADIGDRASYENMPKVQSLIAAQRGRFVLAPGDLTYGDDHGQAAVDQHFNDVMVWSQDAAYMPAWGNHEWDSSGDNLKNYKGRFDFPNPQTSPGSPSVSCCGEDWYWFDYGNARFIAYPEPWDRAWDDWRVKADRLMDEAQADSLIDFIVTFGHRPPYSSGDHGSDTALREILDDLGITHQKYVLNLSGHDHNYERTHPQSGVVHITAGIGGSTLVQSGSCMWPSGCTPPSFTAFRAMRHGAVKLRFTHSAIEGSVICGPAGGGENDVDCAPGTSMDRFSIFKGGVAVASVPGGPRSATNTARVVPNPLQKTGAIRFETLAPGPARIDVFDVRGRRLRVVLDAEEIPAGHHEMVLDRLGDDGERIPAGVYFYRIRAAGQATSGRVLFFD